jgi:hypothetical protein
LVKSIEFCKTYRTSFKTFYFRLKKDTNFQISIQKFPWKLLITYKNFQVFKTLILIKKSKTVKLKSATHGIRCQWILVRFNSSSIVIQLIARTIWQNVSAKYSMHNLTLVWLFSAYQSDSNLLMRSLNWIQMICHNFQIKHMQQNSKKKTIS